MTPVLHPGDDSLIGWLAGDSHLEESETPWRSCISNFIKIGHQEPRQDESCPPSWRWNLDGLVGWRWSS